MIPVPDAHPRPLERQFTTRVDQSLGLTDVDSHAASATTSSSTRTRLLPVFHASADIGCWIGAVVVAALLRYGQIPAPVPAVDLIPLIGITAVAHLTCLLYTSDAADE